VSISKTSAALALALAASLAVTAWYAVTASRRAARLAQLESENAALRGRTAQEPQTVVPAPATGTPAAPRTVIQQAPAPASEHQTVEALRARVTEASGQIAQLEEQLQQLRLEGLRLTQDNKRLAASEADLNDNLSSANRLISAQQAELKSKGDRVTQLEILNQQLRDQANTRNDRITQATRLTGELREIYRRREGVLNSIVRRYREITEQYNALAATLDDRVRTGTPASNTGDLGRIQTAISMAEDDLRQLNSLNAQALRLERQLAQLR